MASGPLTVITRAQGVPPEALLTSALEQLDVAALLVEHPRVAVLAGSVDETYLARLTALLLDAGAADVSVLPALGPLGDAVADVDRSSAELPDGAVLHGTELPSAWLSAGLRVLVTGAATDPVEGYLGACSALAGLLPADSAVDAPEAVEDLLRHLPPHVTIVDATRASDGCFGSVRPAPRPTGTALAGTSALAVDEALATLMGADPAQSRTVAHALAEVGLPPGRRVAGTLRQWEDWTPVPVELTAACARAVTVMPTFARLLRSLAVDAPAPEDDPVLKQGRKLAGAVVNRLDTDPLSLATLVSWIDTGTLVASAARAWSTVFVKSRVPQRQVGLGLELGDYRAADYTAVADYMAPLVEQAAAQPLKAGGLRWGRRGSGVLFSIEREIDAPFDAVAARIDLSRTIRLMNDYVGGAVVVVSRDKHGRVIRQAERNRYLPQPNYLAFSGGDCIDVCKLEVMAYGPTSSTIHWRTVRSPNGTAVHDDGTVTFADAGPGRTRITVSGLQEFVLPPFWQAVDLTRYPALHDALTEDAYRRFFTATLDNLEAAYEGREVVTGRVPERDADPPTLRWSRMLQMAGYQLRDLLGGDDEDGSTATQVDADGFRHVPGTTTTPPAAPSARRAALSEAVTDLRTAVARDLARQVRL